LGSAGLLKIESYKTLQTFVTTSGGNFFTE